MKLRQSLVYLLAVILVFLSLFYLELLLLRPILDFFFKNYVIKSVVFLVLNLFINPILTNKIIHRIIFIQRKW